MMLRLYELCELCEPERDEKPGECVVSSWKAKLKKLPFLLPGVHVASVETLTLARAKALAELGYASVVLSVAAVLGGQGENFAR